MKKTTRQISDLNLLVKPGFHKPNYDHDHDQFWVKTKRLAWRMTAQPYNRFVFVSWSWHLPCNGNQALQQGCPIWSMLFTTGVSNLKYAVYSMVQHSTAQHSTAQHSTAQHSTAQHSTAQHSTAQHSTAQHSTAQHSTAQHSTAQQSTAQHKSGILSFVFHPSLHLLSPFCYPLNLSSTALLFAQEVYFW